MEKQLFFDLSFDGAPETPPTAPPLRSPEEPPAPLPEASPKPPPAPQLSKKRLKRAVLRWLFRTEPPTAAGEAVVTRISRIRADVAAFWSRPVRNRSDEGPSRILTPVRTAIFQCYANREEFWPEAGRSEQILPQLQHLRSQAAELESRIRREEPELREDGTLFEELAQWRYDKSRNREYRQLRRQIDKAEHALYSGTKFERVRSADLADELYLAVPAGLISADELADGWGLLWVADDLSVSVAAEPAPRECLPANRLHLVQNIASVAAGSVLFTAGIRRQRRGGAVFVKKPRGHRKPEPGLASD